MFSIFSIHESCQGIDPASKLKKSLYSSLVCKVFLATFPPCTGRFSSLTDVVFLFCLCIMSTYRFIMLSYEIMQNTN